MVLGSRTRMASILITVGRPLLNLPGKRATRSRLRGLTFSPGGTSSSVISPQSTVSPPRWWTCGTIGNGSCGDSSHVQTNQYSRNGTGADTRRKRIFS